ncbi:MAG: sortase, partial [Lachnospiraceae bacterium]|nr:sortase [Lachnospiraceae bacterium]
MINIRKPKFINDLQEKFTTRQLLALGLIGMGLFLIVSTFGMNLYAARVNKREVTAFREKIFEEKIRKEDSTAGYVSETSTAVDDISDQNEDIIAILRIPSISCEEIVKDGSARWTLAKALGHMEGTAYPGETGNCAIAGHRNYNFGLYFNRL